MNIQKNKKGFTLIESIMAIMLVGIAITALIASNASLTKANAASLNISTAEFLTEEIRELTGSLDFADLSTFAASSPFTPPIDFNQSQLTEFSSFTQTVTIEFVSPADMTTVVESSDFARVTVAVSQNSSVINSANWIITNKE